MSITTQGVYLLKEGETYGPHSFDEVRKLFEVGVLSNEHHYWREGLPAWVSLAELLLPAGPEVEVAVIEVDPPVSEPPVKVAHFTLLSRIAYRPTETSFVTYGLSITIILHILLFLGLSWRFSYAQQTLETVPLSPPSDPPMEISIVTEEQPTPPAPPPPPEVAETTPTPPLPPPLVPDVPVPEPPPPAPAEMPITTRALLAPPVPSPPQVAQQIPSPAPVQLPPPVKKVARVPHPLPPAPVASEQIVQANPTDYLEAPPPNYPYSAERSRQEGTVKLLVTLDAGGQPIDASVYQTSGWAVLDQSALTQVLHHWRFKPGNSSRVLIPIEFSMPQ